MVVGGREGAMHFEVEVEEKQSDGLVVLGFGPLSALVPFPFPPEFLEK